MDFVFVTWQKAIVQSVGDGQSRGVGIVVTNVNRATAISIVGVTLGRPRDFLVLFGARVFDGRIGRNRLRHIEVSGGNWRPTIAGIAAARIEVGSSAHLSPE